MAEMCFSPPPDFALLVSMAMVSGAQPSILAGAQLPTTTLPHPNGDRLNLTTRIYSIGSNGNDVYSVGPQAQPSTLAGVQPPTTTCPRSNDGSVNLTTLFRFAGSNNNGLSPYAGAEAQPSHRHHADSVGGSLPPADAVAAAEPTNRLPAGSNGGGMPPNAAARGGFYSSLFRRFVNGSGVHI
ncbi:hypothetical protein OROMI_013985 [Orobanche minor]